jgi:glutamine amidotransferase
MRATHPTRAACELLDAQNSLIEQSIQDGRGLENPHGWGIGRFGAGATECARQVDPASSSEQFRAESTSMAAETLIAHVRRATVGEPCYENTHPFRDGEAFFAHNGHVGRFDQVRERLLEVLPDHRRERIQGTTDSEHVFQLALSRTDDGASKSEALRNVAARLRRWTESIGEETELFLNTLWAEGSRLVGTKLERSLWYVERDEPIDCDICGETHADPDDEEAYRSIALASEQITDEDWTRIPEGSIVAIDRDVSLSIEPLFE